MIAFSLGPYTRSHFAMGFVDRQGRLSLSYAVMHSSFRQFLPPHCTDKRALADAGHALHLRIAVVG